MLLIDMQSRRVAFIDKELDNTRYFYQARLPAIPDMDQIRELNKSSGVNDWTEVVKDMMRTDCRKSRKLVN